MHDHFVTHGASEHEGDEGVKGAVPALSTGRVA